MQQTGLAGSATRLMLPLAATMLLFFGPMLQAILEDADVVSWRYWKNTMATNVQSLIWWRNFVVAPIAEEWVFRACMIPVLALAGFGFWAKVFIPPLFFGVAHTHHVLSVLKDRGVSMQQAVVVTAFQAFYTTVFGSMAAYYFLMTNCVYGPILAHAFCNMMGFPDFGGALESKHRVALGASYVFGVVAFVVFAMYMPMMV